MAEPTRLEKAVVALGRPIGNGIDAPNYEALEDSSFDELLTMRVEAATADELLRVPGVYEALREHFNNDILEAWEEAEPELAYSGRYQVMAVDGQEPRWDCCFDNPEDAFAELSRLVFRSPSCTGGLVYDAKEREVVVYEGSLADSETDLAWAIAWAAPKTVR